MINGITSYMETFQEIAMLVGDELGKNKTAEVIIRRLAKEGRTGIYSLVTEWTNEFELANLDRVWDGEFFDEIDSFIEKKFNHVEA